VRSVARGVRSTRQMGTAEVREAVGQTRQPMLEQSLHFAGSLEFVVVDCCSMGENGRGDGAKWLLFGEDIGRELVARL